MSARRLVHLVLAGLVALGVAPASAAAQPAAAPSADATAKARALFDAGARAYEAGQFDLAVQAFEEAYAISPREGLLFSLAQAHRKQYAVSRDGQSLRAAVDSYRKYLAAVKEGARRKDAAEALEQLEPLLASAAGAGAAQPAKRATIVQITSNTPGALVSIDGADPAPSPLTRQVPAGVHKVKISAEGFFDEEQTVEALEGQFLPFSFPLRERPARLEVRGADGAQVSVDGRFVGEAPFEAPVELPAGRRFITVSDDGHRPFGVEVSLRRGETRALEVDLETTAQRDASWIVMISGVTIMAAGGAFGVIALAREGDAQEVLETAERQRISLADVGAYESARADRDLFAVASVATLAGGALVSAVGLGLFLFDAPAPLAAPAPDAAPTTPGPAPAPPAGGPSLELGVLPALGPEGGGGSVVGRF